MFPHARNSLRRWSASEQAAGNKKVPIPIGVSLHNVMMVAGQQQRADMSPIPAFRRRPHHEIQLLPLLKLEVLVSDNDGDNEGEATADTGTSGDEGEDSTDNNATTTSHSQDGKYRTVYTCPTLTRSVQPEWEHLDERIDLPGEWWRSRGGRIYKSMRLRITQIIVPPSFEPQEAQHDRSNDGETRLIPPSHADTISPITTNQSSVVFLEIPLYPSKLERLQLADYEVPQSLPPNACLVYFSDGSTRCSSSLFSVLLKHRLTEPSPIEDFSRFEDDVFQTLDSVPETTDRQRSESISALLVEDPQAPQKDLNDGSQELIDEFDGPEGGGGEEDDDEEEKHASAMQQEATELGPEEMSPFEESEETALQADSRKKHERLLAMIAKEEKQLEKEIAFLEEEREEMASILHEARDIERQIHLIKSATKKQTIEFRKDEFRKEAQHMKLLRELQTVYPISLGDSRKGYLIRNLRLPVDIYTTSVPEDEISAALGFCCHLVFMMSKYLSISLRYRLICNSSRSAIQLDRNTFLPLFTSRSVEREHLDRGMGLLGANVDCILMSLGIDFTPKSHILARLKRVYDQIIDGEIPLGIH